jgi:GNAT superfamily N-acetyltransferase
MYGGHFPELGTEAGTQPPPLSFRDAKGRDIEVRAYGDGPVDSEYDALLAMYHDFDSAHRSLGIPPVRESRLQEWLDVMVSDYCVLAWHDDRAVGQAVLIEEEPGRCELAIFLHQDYHSAGIGTRLLEATLSYGREHGVEYVWLLVERENRRAVNLYNDVGFSVVETTNYDITMALTLADFGR